MFVGAPEGGDLTLVSELAVDEGCGELVVEELGPRLARKHLADVCAALTHGLFEADCGGVFGRHRHVFGGSRKPDDVGTVMGEHRLVPRDVHLKLRVGHSHPHQHRPQRTTSPRTVATTTRT